MCRDLASGTPMNTRHIDLQTTNSMTSTICMEGELLYVANMLKETSRRIMSALL